MNEQKKPQPFFPKDRQEFEDKLDQSSIWVERVLLALYRRQTLDEQINQTTRYHNNRGFTPTDAAFMTKWAEHVESKPKNPEGFQYKPGNRLPKSILDKLRQRNERGTHRLGKYWRQICEEIQINNPEKQLQPIQTRISGFKEDEEQ